MAQISNVLDKLTTVYVTKYCHFSLAKKVLKTQINFFDNEGNYIDVDWERSYTCLHCKRESFPMANGLLSQNSKYD